MTLFITSSPFDTEAAFPQFWEKNGFGERLRQALPENPKVAFVASSPEDHEAMCRFGADVFCALRSAGIYPESYTVLDGQNQEDAAEIVSFSDLLVLAGGHVPTQAAFFEEIGLGSLLQDYPGVLLGISAGSMNMAKTVYAQPEEEGEAVDPEYPRFFPGLDLTEVNILPHYNQWKDRTLDGLKLMEEITLPDSQGNCFFVLNDGSYFYQDEETLLLCGESFCARDGELNPLTRDGEVLDMANFE